MEYEGSADYMAILFACGFMLEFDHPLFERIRGEGLPASKTLGALIPPKGYVEF